MSQETETIAEFHT